MFTRKHKSWPSRAGDLIRKYLKLKAVSEAAQGAGKAVKWTAVAKAGKSVAEHTPKKGLLAVAGGVGVGTAALAARKRRGRSAAEPTPA
jgi:hypothetical protein